LRTESHDQAGWPNGVHTENGVWLTLFGVLMADLILGFGQRVMPLMEASLDVRDASLLRARRRLLMTRLRALDMLAVEKERCPLGEADGRQIAAARQVTTGEREGRGEAEVEGNDAGVDLEMQHLELSGDVVGILSCNWVRYQGRMLLGVDWARFPLEHLQSIVCCVGGKVLSRVCWLLAQDYDTWGHGFPDLIFWRPGAREALLVEVKVSLAHTRTPRLDVLSSSCCVWRQCTGMPEHIEER
jgi:hypothetical protein